MYDEAIAALDAHGVAVFPGVLSAAQAARTAAEVRAAVTRLHGVDFEDPATWGSALHRQGFTELYHLPTMWENRQNPDLHALFARLLGTERLWVSVDRVGVKRPGRVPDPRRPGQWFDKPEWGRDIDIHFDLNPWHLPAERRLQALIALEDTATDQGGFACVPGFHHEIADWAAANPRWAKPPEKVFVRFKDKALTRARLARIAAKAGDLVVWDSRLPHGNSRNHSDRWRLCQYLTFFPAVEANRPLQEEALEAWRTGHRPGVYPGGKAAFDHGPQVEATDTPPPLSALGRRLLGLDQRA